MIVRILQVQAETDLGLWTYMKIVLRVIPTMLTKSPIPMNTAIRTPYSIMKHIGVRGTAQYLLSTRGLVGGGRVGGGVGSMVHCKGYSDS